MRNKRMFIVFFVCLAILTVFCVVKSPKLHKPFQVDIIEYILKFNDDGSLTKIKSSTTTVINRETEND